MIVDPNLPKYYITGEGRQMTEEEATHYEGLLMTDSTIMRNYFKQELRSYEVSLWTLLDEFITVLKWSDAELLGRILEPKMTLNVDGTLTFSFSIPMYLNLIEEGEKYISASYLPNSNVVRKENPIWYSELLKNKLNLNKSWDQLNAGNLITSMRKIKVIFNKGTVDLYIYEFIITKVTEEHLQDLLMCKVECEGLAFHELGKIGYKFKLGIDDFMVDYENWATKGSWSKYDGTSCTTEPIQNVQYWCDKCGLIPRPNNANVINPRKWYYGIYMKWDANSSETRYEDVVYENAYTSSWDEATLDPVTVESSCEKARPISVENSNLYNITQTIAEEFGIFCKYEYEHDENFHITGRTVVFYNNFPQEKDNAIGFTYPYMAKSITREMDSTELVTKMYVIPLEDSTTFGGEINIIDSPANPSKEDYLLNFDYMYAIGAITQELYDEINNYNKDMRALNEDLEYLSLTLDAYNAEKIDLEAEIKLLDESARIAQELLDVVMNKFNKLDTDDGVADGYISRTGANHYSTLIKRDSATNNYYFTFNDEDKGIDTASVHLYKAYLSTTASFNNEDEITGLTFITDEDGDITRVNVAYDFSTLNSKIIYLTYRYKPSMYYEVVIARYTTAKETAETDADTKRGLLTTLNNNINYTLSLYDTKLVTKKEIMIKFEEMMGPALREGYWQPEKYSDYGKHKHVELTPTNTYNASTLIPNAHESAVFGWDATLFEEETKIYYELGINRDKHYYPCVDLSDYLSFVQTVLANNEVLSFVFNNNYYRDLKLGEDIEVLNLTNFAVGGKAELGFIRAGSNIKPVLILLGTLSMTDEEIKFMLTTGTGKGNPRLCVFKTPISNEGKATVDMTARGGPISIDKSKVYWDLSIISGVKNIKASNVKTVYPRIKFSDLRLKTSDSCFSIKYDTAHDYLLKKYEDYTMLSRTTTRTEDGSDRAYLEYFVTIKPKVIFYYDVLSNLSKKFIVDYILSNAATSIYIDAKEILHDSAYPKVSYTVEVNLLNREYIRILYKMLTLLVMINDTDLKFLNVFGYISQVELDLDLPQNDTIEVKNYKTKFEDLFSTIVALTEQMKRYSDDIVSAATGKVALSSTALEKSLSLSESVLGAYLDSHFDSSEVVKTRLKELFTDAGKILSESNAAIQSVFSINEKNAEILSGLSDLMKSLLSSLIYTGPNQPTSFKDGDIWIETDSSGNVISRRLGINGGFTKTYDGSLSAITGANINIDADSGTIELLAKSNIALKSGHDIDIAAQDSLNIVGNNQVNIGGGTINIGSDGTNGSTAGGVNIVAAGYNTNSFTKTPSGNDISKVLIHPDEITMMGSKINMYTSASENISAIKIDGEEGIWMGSNRSIVMYSSSGSTGTTVEIVPTRFFVGQASGSDAAMTEITANHILFALGLKTTDTSSLNIAVKSSDGNLTGLKITRESFGLAIGSNDSRSVIVMNSTGITVGTGTDPKQSNLTGSYVTISGAGVEIGSLGNLYLNTANVKLLTNSTYGTRFALGSNMGSINTDNISSASNSNMGSGSGKVGLVFNTNGLYINGNVYASTFIAPGNSQQFKASSSELGFYTTSGTAIATISSTGMTIALNYALTINGNLDLSANNITLASSGSGTYTVFSLRKKSGTTYTNYLKYTSDGKLTIKADSITLGTDTTAITSSSLFTMTDSLVWTAVKSATSLTGLKLTDSSIKLDVNSSSHIYIDNNGIDMLGKRIKINDKEVWARDDILIVGLNEEDEETAISNAGIDLHKTDFVVIKPYYDAKIMYKYLPVYSIRAESGSNVIEIPLTTSEALSFGNGASWYRYLLSGVIHRSSSETQSSGALITVILSNNRDMTSSISFSGNVDTGNSTIWFTIDSGNLSGLNAVNLCGEGKLIYMKVYGQYVYDNVTDLTLLCTSATSTSKVPCTVYYYPKLPNN